MLNRSYFIRTLLSGAANAFVSAIAATVAIPYVISRVGLETYGIVASLNIFIAVGTVVELGLSKAVAYFVSRAPVAHRAKQASLGLLVATVLCALVGVLYVACLLLKLDPLRGTLIPTMIHPATLLAGTTIIMAYLITAVARGVLEGCLLLPFVHFGYLLLTTLYYAVLICMTFATRNPVALAFGVSATHIMIMSIHLHKLRTVDCLRLLKPSARELTDMLRYAISTVAASIPMIVLFPLLNLLLLRSLSNGGAYAIFDIAFRIAALPTTALATLAAPILVAAANDPVRWSQRTILLIRNCMASIALAMILGLLVYVLIAPRALTLMYGNLSPDLYRVSLPLVVGMGILSCAEPISRAFLGYMMLTRLFVARLAMLMCVVATPLVEMADPLRQFSLGVAVAYSICGLFLVAGYLRATHRHCQVRL